jgi:hypothetical protein
MVYLYSAQTKTSSSLKKPFLSLQISALLGERVYVVKKSDTGVGEDMAHCKLCNTNFSVAAGTLYDVKRLAKRSTHPILIELELTFFTNLAPIFGG